MTVQVYSPGDVVVTFGGYVLEEWESIEVQRVAEAFRMIRGIRGKNTRVRTNNTAADITITVPITSRANAVFSEIAQLDEATGNGRLEITIKDTSGFEVFTTTEGFVERQATVSYTKNSPDRTWVIHCMNSTFGRSATTTIESIFESFFG